MAHEHQRRAPLIFPSLRPPITLPDAVPPLAGAGPSVEPGSTAAAVDDLDDGGKAGQGRPGRRRRLRRRGCRGGKKVRIFRGLRSAYNHQSAPGTGAQPRRIGCHCRLPHCKDSDISETPATPSDPAAATTAPLDATTSGTAFAATKRHLSGKVIRTPPPIDAAPQQPHGSDSNGRGALSILSLNILSLKPKILELRHDLELFNCDIAVICETWLRPETSSRFVTIPGFSLHRADRPDGSGYGGIAVLLKDHLKVKPLKSVESVENDGKIETLWLQVFNPHGRRFNLGCVYRPPDIR